jgi:homoserine kinase
MRQRYENPNPKVAKTRGNRSSLKASVGNGPMHARRCRAARKNAVQTACANAGRQMEMGSLSSIKQKSPIQREWKGMFGVMEINVHIRFVIGLFCPASIGNFGVGFDVLGAAVEGIGDRLWAEATEEGLEIEVIKGEVPADPALNTVTLGAKFVLEALAQAGEKLSGIRFRLEKGMPVGSGLGSSAAGAVGGAYAANVLLGNKLNSMQVLAAATEAEARVSGGFFADNTAACLLGGMTVVVSHRPLQALSFPPPEDMLVILAFPNVRVMTADARAVLPKHVAFADAVSNLSKTAGVVAAFATGRYDLFRSAGLLEDRLGEPYRKHLIPGYERAKAAALAAGADGCAISGSGPTVFALSDSLVVAERVAGALGDAFGDCPTRITRIARTGVRRIE